MVKMSVVYDGKLHTTITHELTGQKIHTDAPKDNGGKGENFSPTDLVAAALASCIVTVVNIYAERKGISLEGMKIDIEKEMATGSPRRIGKLSMDIFIPKSLSDEEKRKVEEIAHHCPVHHSLHPDIVVTMQFHYS